MSRSALVRRVAFLVGVACVFVIVGAQENPLVSTQPGSWQAALPITPQRMATELTLPERTAVKASVNQLLEIAGS